MKVLVCVGSSCHLRGSYEIVNLMKESIAKNGIEADVDLGGAFCFGKCTDGVTIKVDDEVISGVSKENFDEIFNKYILKK